MFDPSYFDPSFFDVGSSGPEPEPTVPYRRPRLFINIDGSRLGYGRRRRAKRRRR